MDKRREGRPTIYGETPPVRRRMTQRPQGTVKRPPLHEKEQEATRRPAPRTEEQEATRRPAPRAEMKRMAGAPTPRQRGRGAGQAQYSGRAAKRDSLVEEPKRSKEKENEKRQRMLWGILGVLVVLLIAAIFYEIVLGYGTKQTGSERMNEQLNMQNQTIHVLPNAESEADSMSEKTESVTGSMTTDTESVTGDMTTDTESVTGGTTADTESTTGSTTEAADEY